MQHCVDSKSGTVILLGDFSDCNSDIFKALFSSVTPVDLIRIEKNDVIRKHKRLRTDYVLSEAHFKIKNDPATSIIISASSNDSLAMAFENLRDSIWWNHEALFLIINKKLEDNCRQAGAFLATAWSYNILSAIYLCTDSFERLFIYTFNPFNDMAPQFWRRVKVNYLLINYKTLLVHPVNASDISSFIYSKYFDREIVMNRKKYPGIVSLKSLSETVLSPILMIKNSLEKYTIKTYIEFLKRLSI